MRAMSILGWIVLGLISGFIASKAVKGSGSGCLTDIVLGLIGAVVGGWLFSYFGHTDPMHFNLTSMVIAIIGAVVVLLVWHAITGRWLRR
jgi:uncharacterized membrane protein YeaQ/YmgE (transglycosylase-associated protein family)